eukprot:g56648.t1
MSAQGDNGTGDSSKRSQSISSGDSSRRFSASSSVSPGRETKESSCITTEETQPVKRQATWTYETARADPIGRVNGLKLLFLLVRGEREDKGCELLDGPEPVYVDQQDSGGKSALMEAVKLGQERMMKRLLALGADPNAQDNRGNSVLMYAVTHGNSSAVEVLMKMGRTDVNLVNNEGKKAVDLVEDAYGSGRGRGRRGYQGGFCYLDSGYVRELLILGDTLFAEYKQKMAELVHAHFCPRGVLKRNGLDSYLAKHLVQPAEGGKDLPYVPEDLLHIIVEYACGK